VTADMLVATDPLEAALDLHRRGDLAEAERLYRAILDDDPDSVNALYLLGVVARATGRAEEAVALIGRAVALAPHFAEAQLNLGHALKSCGRFAEAAAAYQAALDHKDLAAARDGLAAIEQGGHYLDALRTTLEQEYKAGRWSYLGQMSETARYGVVSSYVRAAAPAGPLLDLGCGAGTLYPHLPHGRITAYVGVDISAEALAAHLGRAQPAAPVQLVASPLESFAPAQGARFAAIIFNEVLLYVLDPLAALRRFRASLAPGGILVVSWYRMKDPGQLAKEEATWAALQAPDWGMLDWSLLRNQMHGLDWRIAVLRPV
jgi:2-polyprenyl-6-hydroxyphenyl methylase/3-demethylubiquinone-9 3-methyltransferase